ncbi:MAG: aminodeoxychorismate synthase component I [Solirubrobacteraceae bacterium]
MPALRARRRPSLFRAPLHSRLSLGAALRCLHDTDRPFALTGAWAGGGALLGHSPLRVAGKDEDAFGLLAESPQDPGAGTFVGGGWIGYLGYPMRASVERVDPPPPASHSMPAFALAYYDHVVRRDADGAWWFEALWSAERARELDARRAWWSRRLADPPPERTARVGGWRTTPSPEGHAELVAACRERIHAGDLFQANVCAQLSARFEGSPLELFVRGVRALAPDRAAYLSGPWGAVVGLSPELFLERHGRRVRSAPIKGTRRRPADPRRAAAERAALESSAKDRAENVMIVDLMRNDLGRVCRPGTVAAGPLAQVRGPTGVWHLVSEVAGELRPGVDDGDLLRAAFPPGSVTGAPKLAAMNVIAELESSERQVYTGAIGFAGPYAGLELNVAIRTFELTGTEIRLGIGGGVVADSEPDAEAGELAVKAAPLLEALGAPAPSPSGHRSAPRVRRLGPFPVPRPDPRAGIFETVLVRDGHALRIESHLARLRASVAGLYGAELPDHLCDDIGAAAAGVEGFARLRVDAVPQAGGMPVVTVSVRALGPTEAVALRSWTIPGGLGAHKWIDRRLIDALEGAAPVALPLLVDADGQVLEASRASVFALGEDGIVRTPPNDGRILPGVARARMLECAAELGLRVQERPLTLAELRKARGVILTSALRCTPVQALDARPLPCDERLPALGRSALAADGLRAAVS